MLRNKIYYPISDVEDFSTVFFFISDFTLVKKVLPLSIMVDHHI